MKNIILFGIIFLSLVFARRDCLQQAELDALGRSSRTTKDTLAISPSGHFYIHFDTTGYAAPDLTDSDDNGIPDYVDEVGIIADSALNVLVYEMGFDVEPFDGDGGYDILIISYGPKAYGHCYHEGNGISYLKIDNDYIGYDSNFGQTPLKIMQIALVHEYFHAIQYGYQHNHGSGSGSDAYFYEMTSMWIEDVIVPDGNDYLEDMWVGPFLDIPQGKFDNRWPLCSHPDVCDGEGYELALFGHYLSSYVDLDGSLDEKQSTIMNEIWTEYSNSYHSSNNYDKPLVVIDRILKNEFQSSFIESWVDFISRNLYNGLYGEDENNPFYFYSDQALIDPIKTTSTMLVDSALIELDLDNKSATIESFLIGNLESLITIEHGIETFIGRVAIFDDTPNYEYNNLFWGDDTTVEESFNNAEVHFVYGVDGSSITLPIKISAHTVPLPPSNLMAVAAQDSIILSWNPSPGPGKNLSYVVFRDNILIDSLNDTNYVDQGIEGGQSYTYKVTCRNTIGESSASNAIYITSWPNEEDVISSIIMSIYPNPIRQSQELTILYALDSNYSKPIVNLINVRGEVVSSIKLSSFSQGWHRENINSILNNNPSNGVYFICFQPDKESRQTKKVTILN